MNDKLDYDEILYIVRLVNETPYMQKYVNMEELKKWEEETTTRRLNRLITEAGLDPEKFLRKLPNE